MGLGETVLSWPDMLDALLAREDLDAETARQALDAVMEGHVDPVVVAGWLVAMRSKGETSSEMVGLVRAMLDHSIPVDLGADILDVVGTGGDRSGTVNISTMTALVCAGAGVRVAKHGNRAASSECGSADVLEALGVDIALGPDGVIACVDEAGIGFMFAPTFHPAMKHVVPVRRSLGIRTVFNILGPLANPARVDHMLLGVATVTIGERMVEALAELGVSRALVVHGADGLDELSTTGLNRVWEVAGGVITHWEIDPAGLGLERVAVGDLRGGSPEENAAVARSVLAGDPGPIRDVVLLNASAALLAARRVDDLAGGLEVAAQAIDSGAASEALAKLVAVSGRHGSG